MRVFRSTCKRGKIIPLWGTNALRKSKEKNEKNKIKGEKPKMKIEIKNCCYWVELENNKVYIMVNGDIKEQLRVQEKINHVIHVAKRIQKIRKVYKSKIIPFRN